MATEYPVPNSQESEEAVLGAIMLETDVLIEVIETIDPTDFYYLCNETTYRAMLDMWGKSQPIDILTLQEHLKQHKQLDKIGGLVYLDQLFDQVPASENAKHYAQIIRDKAYRRYIRESCIHAARDISSDSEINDVIGRLSKTIMDITSKSAGRSCLPFKDLIEFYKKELGEKYNNPEDTKISFSSGLPSLDKVIDGFYPATLNIIAARPGVGKTALALNIAFDIAQAGGNVVFFSLEMKDVRLIDRIMANLCSVDSRNLRRGRLTETEFGKVMETDFGEIRFEIDHYTRKLEGIKSRCKYWEHRYGKVDMVVIDYMQIVQAPGKSDYERVSYVSRSLHHLAMDMDCAVLALAQINRAGDDKPTMNHIKNTGQIEQDADLILILHRLERGEFGVEKMDLSIAKNRSGSQGGIELNYFPKYNRFGETVKPDISLPTDYADDL